MHIYAFGSIVRGDITTGSDVDLLSLVEGHDHRFDPGTFSIYSYQRAKELWQEGNPFAWHLALESRLLYASDGCDFLRNLGKPTDYRTCVRDCEKFLALFQEAITSLSSGSSTVVFDLSTVFLSIRNFATCYSLGMDGSPNFSRGSALALGRDSIPISLEAYRILERARILSTRGAGGNIRRHEIGSAVSEFDKVKHWMETLLIRAQDHGRV